MKAAVFIKDQNGSSEIIDGSFISLNAPSVVQVQLGPEQVLRYDRDGDDLRIVLKDGSILVIENFFVGSDDGRNDLVLEDANHVTWWAQYGDVWDGFDIAEIDDTAAIGLWPLWTGLGLLAAGLVGGGGPLVLRTPLILGCPM